MLPRLGHKGLKSPCSQRMSFVKRGWIALALAPAASCLWKCFLAGLGRAHFWAVNKSEILRGLAQENEVILHLRHSNWNCTSPGQDARVLCLVLCFGSPACSSFPEGGSGYVWNTHLHYIVLKVLFPNENIQPKLYIQLNKRQKQGAIEPLQ